MKIKVLKDYIKKLDEANLLVWENVSSNLLDVPIDCVSYDTRTLHGKSIFICKGLHFKPEYAKDALDKSALAYVSKEPIEGLPNCIQVNDIRKSIYVLADTHFDSVQNKLKIVGITGTKGKGSVAYILKGIMDEYLNDIHKPECAIISSIETYDGIKKYESHLTTPETIELYENFSNAYNSGISHVLMEVSSQANKLGRTIGVPYEVACFTNFGKDHISPIEHPNIQDYFECKLHIFDNVKFACINSDSDRFSEIYNYAKDKKCEIVTFGSHDTDNVYCTNIKPKGSEIDFDVKTKDFEDTFTLGVPGIFNVSNALAAIAIAQCFNIDKSYICKGLKKASIPGRMKVVTSKDKKIVAVVDYAHNQMSFNAYYESLKKEYLDYNIVSVFGCPGNKALDRREELPEIASKYASHIIITEDDPATEPFENIIKDMIPNININNYEIIENREDAIKHAIFDLAKDKTVVALTGKGEEITMTRGENFEPYESDLLIAKRYIGEYDKSVGM